MWVLWIQPVLSNERFTISKIEKRFLKMKLGMGNTRKQTQKSKNTGKKVPSWPTWLKEPDKLVLGRVDQNFHSLFFWTLDYCSLKKMSEPLIQQVLRIQNFVMRKQRKIGWSNSCRKWKSPKYILFKSRMMSRNASLNENGEFWSVDNKSLNKSTFESE